MTADEALALVQKGGSGGAHRKVQKPRPDEILAGEVERLRGELAERDRSAVRLIAENAQLRESLRQAEARPVAEPEQTHALRRR